MKNTAQKIPTATQSSITPSEAPSLTPAVTLEEVEALTNDLKHLLVRYESTLEEEGIRHHIETMERWMESYRRGISAAHKLSENAPHWLEEVRSKLKLAADELQRLEGEGGNPATSEQRSQEENLLKAVKRIDDIAPQLEQTLGCNCEESKPV